MNASTITVHWHDDNMPVYSSVFQPQINTGTRSKSKRLVTGGGDNNIRIWTLQDNQVHYLSTLRKHTQAVNVVRFNNEGDVLASAGDDGTIILWRLSDTIQKDFNNADDELKESWIAQLVIRCSTAEIIDLAWSPDSKYIAVGSMDNMMRIYNTSNGTIVSQLNNHNHYVQGVSWDPLNEYLTTQSADKTVNIYRLKFTPELNIRHLYKIIRVEIPVNKMSENPTTEFRNRSIYFPETLQSFFRRLKFSPDGNLLVTPSGIYRKDDEESEQPKEDEKDTPINSVYIYTRSNLNKPAVHLPGFKKPAIVIGFSPVVYVNEVKDPVFKLPYKMIFAVATQDSVIVYDTANLQPLGIVSNLHYSTITDLTWDNDGQQIIVSSADGFCSLIKFEDVFGQVYNGEFVSVKEVRQESPRKETSKKDVANIIEKVPSLVPVQVPSEPPVPPVQAPSLAPVQAPAPENITTQTINLEKPVNTIDHLLKKKDKKRITPTVIN